MKFSFSELYSDLPVVRVVDVGASPIDGPPPYQPLIDIGKANVIGFEPDEEQYRALQQHPQPFATYLPYAVGDGREGVLNVCRAPGMTSLLEPDMEILNHFHGFPQWGEVLNQQKLTTRKLDDIAEIGGIDFLKLDVQGSELSILSGAGEKLKDTLVVHTEVQFVPFYKNQPLFAELDQALRAAGFYLHRFTPLVSRVFKPLVINNNVFAGMSQVLWSDAIYVRQFTSFSKLPRESLLKIALVLHELYGSYDMSALALGHIDAREGTQLQTTYLRRLMAPQ
ncbi:MAG: FkbM family methyltransferase [Aureliella sp.]